MAGAATDDLARDLVAAGYTGLFLAGDSSRAGEVWDEGRNRSALEELVRDERAADVARILAAEVVRAGDAEFPAADLRATLAAVYARGLVATAEDPGALDGNLWGLLWEGERLGIDALGPLGAHLLECGDAARPHLEALLDQDGRILFVGSEEATIGNRMRYRVKDAAAYFLGRVTGTSVAFHEDAGARDDEIARLRTTLGEAE